MIRRTCVRRDTPPLGWHALAWLGWFALAMSCACTANAEPRELDARVIWTRDDLVYLASPDSGVLVAGMQVSLRRGRRELASGAITRLLEPRLAVARLGTGSLASERRLDRLSVRGELGVLAHASTLRVGLPGRGRQNLLFDCGTLSVSNRLGHASYALDSLADGTYRLVRDARVSDTPVTPETLLVRLFADAADQEIALERGELDAAVFWPGELSARMRGDARWRDAPLGVRARGVLAALSAEADSIPPPTGELEALNRDLFAGDLLAWSELEPGPEPALAPTPARWSVDATLPGARLFERVLARGTTAAGARPLRLAYLDVPLAAPDSVQSAWRTRGVTPLFALRCPVLAAPAARAFVAGLGAGAFANLVVCGGATP